MLNSDHVQIKAMQLYKNKESMALTTISTIFSKTLSSFHQKINTERKREKINTTIKELLFFIAFNVYNFELGKFYVFYCYKNILSNPFYSQVYNVLSQKFTTLSHKDKSSFYVDCTPEGGHRIDQLKWQYGCKKNNEINAINSLNNKQ